MIKKLIAIGLMGGLWMFSTSALAVTPGNVNLENTATLFYDGNATGITANATVVVNVISSNPSLSDVGTITKAEGQEITTEATYTITATNNGLDTYNFDNAGVPSISNATNATLTGVSYEYRDDGGSVITSLQLGVTALAVSASQGNTTITVPADGNDTDGIVNGIANGDTVVILGDVYTISAPITESGSNNVVLTLDRGLDQAVTYDVATGVFERTTFTVRTNGASGVGSKTDPALATSYDVSVALTGTVVTDATQATASDVFTVVVVNITIDKFVRNVTRDNCDDGGACAADLNVDAGSGVQNYYLTTGTKVVDARSAEVLEYVIRVVTPADGALVNARITDVLDVFTSFNSGSLKILGRTVSDEGTGDNTGAATPAFPLDPGADDGGLLINDDTFVATGTEEGGGAVADNKTVYILYRVTVL